MVISMKSVQGMCDLFSAGTFNGQNEETAEFLRGGTAAKQIQEDPDCGLRTRAWPKTVPASENMGTPAAALRAQLIQ